MIPGRLRALRARAAEATAAWWSWVDRTAEHHPQRPARFGAALLQIVASVTTALLVGLWLWGRPVVHAALTSPQWTIAASRVGALARSWKATAAGLLLCVLAWLAGPTSTLEAFPAAVGAAWLALRSAMAAYPHTTRGRVRVRFGVAHRGVRDPATGGGPDGFALALELRRTIGAHAVREAAVATRPSIAAGLPPDPDRTPVTSSGTHLARVSGQLRQAGAVARQRATRLAAIEALPIEECGTWLGRTAIGPWFGTQCYAAHRDSVGIVAPPQTGKSALLGHHIVDHPGAVVSTSTKPDLYLNTAALRVGVAGSGRVELFNPEGLGDLPSTFRWDLLRGCALPSTARLRAGHLVGGVGRSRVDDDGDRWEKWAVGVLAALLMAAERGGAGMADVAHWVFEQNEGAKIALSLLQEVAGQPVPQLVIDALRQVTTTEAKKTRDSIFLTLRDAVGFMADPAVAEMVTPGSGDPVFDVAAFVADHGTLYILGSDSEHSGVAPLLAALTGYVFETAKLVATTYPGERLDPPLMIALDEAALITLVALDRWLADAGGRGIHLLWAVQSRSQLAQRWGARGAETIWNATNIKLIMGGTTVVEDLEAISRLTGHRYELVPDPDGPTTRRGGRGYAKFDRVPVVTPDRVRRIPQWHALLLHREATTIVRFRPVWRRLDVRLAGRIPRPTPAREALAADGQDLVETDPPTEPILIPENCLPADSRRRRTLVGLVRRQNSR